MEEIRQANALLKPAAEDRGVQAGDFVVWTTRPTSPGSRWKAASRKAPMWRWGAASSTPSSKPTSWASRPERKRASPWPCPMISQSPHCRKVVDSR